MCTRLLMYLHQTAVLERFAGVDDCATPLYEPAEKIAVRRESAQKLVRDAQGNEMLSQTTYFCLENILPQDRLDGEVVLATQELFGRVGREGMRVFV